MNKQSIRLVMFDLDGTLYRKGEVIFGAVEAIETIREAGYKIAFLTNTDSVPPEAVKDRLNHMGIKAYQGEVISPPVAVTKWLSKRSEKASYFMVSEALKPMFSGFLQDNKEPDHVIIGDLQGKVAYDDLNDAFRMLKKNAELITMNKGRFIEKKDGPHLDTGAFVALLEYASQKEARIMGKPSREYMEAPLDLFGVEPHECIMIGDDLAIDIVGAKEIGCGAILVKTGSYDEEALMNAEVKPDEVLDSIADLPAFLRSK